MPVYEYRCRHCGEAFSRLQRMDADTAEVVCPACGHQDAERLLSSFASASGGGFPGGARQPSSSCGGST